MPDRKTLYLVDGHAHFFRAYHAIRPGMTSPVTKEPTNMTYGFVSMLIKLLREHQPSYIAVVIDAAGDRETFRSEIYPDYKANRKEPPDDFHPQVLRCLQVLEEMGIPIVGIEGVEADDAIASIARQLTSDGEHDHVKVRIVSRDKDLTQLIDDDRIDLFDIYKDEVVSPGVIFKSENVNPEHVRDILALMGDTVDNIPGVPGVGPKTAAQLIREYGSIENLYAHIDEIKGKRRERLEESRELVEVSRRLVTLRDDCEVDFELDAAAFDPAKIDVPRLQAVFRELGFHRQLDDIAELAGPEAGKPGAEDGGFEESLFGLPSQAGAAPSAPGEYETILSVDALDEIIGKIREAGVVAFDVETSSLSPLQAELCGVSMSVAAGTGVYVPTCSPSQETHLQTACVLDRLRPVLEDHSIRKIGHNLKFDLNVLRRHGIRVVGPLFDTMVASYVIDATRSSHGLDALSLAFLKHTCIPITEVIGKGKNQRSFREVPLEVASTYAAEDADVTYRLHDIFAPRIEQMELGGLFDDVEMPLVEVLAELEYNGVHVDPDELDRQREALAERIEELRERIVEASPHPFNPDSPKQLAAALFNKPHADPPGLGIRPLKRGKTGPSTDQEVLEKLAADPSVETEVPAMIVEYRQLTKLVNTYLLALKEAINPETQRVHASFNQTVTATGRLSSSDPNLQNIPIRTDIGRRIRRAFVAERGNLLIAADYSQIELRILAHLSGDPGLIEAFRSDADIHTAVASEVYDIEPGEVTPTHRNSAKMINFGIVYGITPYGLARRLGGEVTNEEAGRIIADYKARFSRIGEFLDECVRAAETQGYVETMLGRRRPITQIGARNPQMRALGERMAINTVVQGSAADLIKLAMIDLHRRLPGSHPSARLLLQIHDELVLETPEADAPAVCDFVVASMESAMDLSVPLKVESSVAPNWAEAK